MSVLSRLYTGTGAFDIVGRRKTWYIGFGLLVLVCVVSMVFRGFNLGIDFTGGTQIQFPTNTATAPATVPAVQDVFQQSIGVEPASVQTAGAGPAAVVLIRSETLSLAQTVTVKQALFDAFGPRGADGVPSPNVISISAVSGVLEAGLRTAVFPVARQGPSFQAAISCGKFQGTISAQTPSGSRSV